jgi:hypothetical protein
MDGARHQCPRWFLRVERQCCGSVTQALLARRDPYREWRPMNEPTLPIEIESSSVQTPVPGLRIQRFRVSSPKGDRSTGPRRQR